MLSAPLAGSSFKVYASDQAQDTLSQSISDEVSDQTSGDRFSLESLRTLSARYQARVHESAKPFITALSNELTQIERGNLHAVWQQVADRIRAGSVNRVVWLLIFMLLFSGSIFILSVTYGITARLNSRLKIRATKKRSASRKHRSYRQFSDRPSELPKTVHKSMTLKEILMSGNLNQAERKLRASIKLKRDSPDLFIYMFACRAVKADRKLFKSLIMEHFPKGLEKDIEFHRHIAQIGSMLSLKEYSKGSFPEPESVFRTESNMVGNTLGSISELGDVQTMVDIARVYVDMKDVSQAKHMLVEILVRGNKQQRESATELSRALKRNQEAEQS